MFSIRSVKTSSGAIAIQVIRYQYRKTIVLAHIGSAHSQKEIKLLKQAALDWIRQKTRQIDLFSKKKPSVNKILLVDKAQYLGERYTFFSEIIFQLFNLFGFTQTEDVMLLHMVLIRILEPASKLRSIELLKEYFGISYSRSNLYRQMPQWTCLKDGIESKVVLVAKKHFGFNFKLVFYDVTTLYFESFTSDDLRKLGFSKDYKFNQPQILIGLLVTKDGFPVAYEVFEGNTFEGHTLLPAILRLKQKYEIDKLTIVADAAMLSLDNIQKLLDQKLYYIVGARLGNMNIGRIRKLSNKVNGKDGSTVRIKTDYGFLICDFSRKRYNKDKHDMDKQIKKAKAIIAQPSKSTKRYKFVKQSKNKLELNQSLIDKTNLLLGIKGYYTNLQDKDENIIKAYRGLWQIEKSFRIAKSDLEIRPIYHWKQKAIKAHILLCFMALSIIKYMEIKTDVSSQKIIRLLKSVTDARILNKLTGEEVVMRSEISDEVKRIVKLMNLSY